VSSRFEGPHLRAQNLPERAEYRPAFRIQRIVSLFSTGRDRTLLAVVPSRAGPGPGTRPLPGPLLPDPSPAPPPRLGAGIFFFWQVGAVRYLLDNFEGVEDMRMVGASAGALISTLTACGVAPETTLLEAYRLTLEMGVWGRPLGLLGLWGDLVRAWLDRLLPEDAGERCSGRVALVVTRLPGLQLEGFHRFRSKSDLVDATMASAHVPFFLDFKGWSTFRGMACMDGSLVEFLSNGRAASYEPFVRGAEHAGIDLDYFYDEELQWSRADFLKLRSYEDVVGLYAKGYDFARRLDREGRAPAMARMARRPAPLAAGPDTEALLAAGRAIEAELAQARAAAAEGLN